MKIVFMGTPAFAVPSLAILIDNGYDVRAVVTAPGKQAGRGLQIRHPAVKEYADIHNIPVLQPVKLSDPEFHRQLQEINADLFIVVAFRMLPEKVWTMPPLGTFNLHGSLLPQYRGAAPINRAIMNGEKETGVTTFFLRHAIDTGDILFREKIIIHDNETAGELHDRMMDAGAKLVLKTVKAIETNNIHPVAQSEFLKTGEQLHEAPKIFPADCRINWIQSSNSIHNQVRGLSPFPGAYTILQDESGQNLTLKIYRTEITTIKSLYAPGVLHHEKDALYISCADFNLKVVELQLEGKKRISADQFVKGFRFDKGWKALPY
jgi:methionyl-tRNA formyltransferase